MKSRVSWAGMALAAMLAMAVPAFAQEAGYRAGKGGIGGQLGGSSFVAEGDYSAGAAPRFSFAAHWRYAMTPWLRWQISPGFTWAGYDAAEPAPFVDQNFPQDRTKEEYLTLLAPVSAQLQLTMRRAQWLYYVGGGPGVYRVWVENHRKVVEDPVTHKLHRGVYLGGSGQIGAERFLKALPNTSVEIAIVGHLALARRDEQFPSGFNNSVAAVGIHVGGNYYFAPNKAKPQASPAPEPPKP